MIQKARELKKTADPTGVILPPIKKRGIQTYQNQREADAYLQLDSGVNDVQLAESVNQKTKMDSMIDSPVA